MPSASSGNVDPHGARALDSRGLSNVLDIAAVLFRVVHRSSFIPRLVVSIRNALWAHTQKELCACLSYFLNLRAQSRDQEGAASLASLVIHPSQLHVLLCCRTELNPEKLWPLGAKQAQCCMQARGTSRQAVPDVDSLSSEIALFLISHCHNPIPLYHHHNILIPPSSIFYGNFSTDACAGSNLFYFLSFPLVKE